MQSSTSSAATKYQHSQVTHADPAELIVLLYNGALSRIAQGQQRLQEKDLLQAGLAISKAQAIVGELRNSLNMEVGGEIAAKLKLLYSYIHELFVKAMLANRTEPLDEAAKLLTELRGGWEEVATRVKGVLDKNQTATHSDDHPSGTQDPIRMQVRA